MKKTIILLTAVFFIASNNLFADDDRIKMRLQDRLIFDIFIDIWQNSPEEMDLKFFNRGINVALLQDFPIGYSNFAIAAGLSFSGHNMYSDHWYRYSHEDDNFDFEKIYDDLDYRNNKININYIDIPLEFRYRTRPSREIPHPFRITIGAKFGYMIQAKTKYSGDWYSSADNGEMREVKFKEINVGNIESWRYGIMCRIGYGFVNLTAYYPLSEIFEGNTVEDMIPVSLGISFTIN